ncbi:MAG: hypothetical protein ACXU95_16160, partial [Isosphaeraceae bacterium]
VLRRHTERLDHRLVNAVRDCSSDGLPGPDNAVRFIVDSTVPREASALYDTVQPFSDRVTRKPSEARLTDGLLVIQVGSRGLWI